MTEPEERDAEEQTAAAVEEFTGIPVKLPPMLMSMMGYPAGARYVAIYYMGSKATWDDGRGLRTFSYYSVFKPLKEHPTLALYLLDAHLGSDDEYPTHAILCDREERRMFVGDYRRVVIFCRQQHAAAPSAEEVAQYAEGGEALTTGAEFHRAGIFEMFTRPDERAQRETGQLIEWLDSHITEELVAAIAEKWRGGDLRLMHAVEYLLRLAELAEQQPEDDEENGAEEEGETFIH